jgi:putative spermidine/putrescine transport system permease protein
VNATLEGRALREAARFSQPETQQLLGRAVDRLGLSVRGVGRVLRVTRTIADLAGDVVVRPEHLAEALQFRSALEASIEAAIGATVISLVLGSLIAFAIQRHAFFGRQTLSFLVVLPLALPGIITGIALNTALRTIGAEFGLLTIIVGHATFCVVVVFNNVVARLRRISRTAEEASADLGADTFQTLRRVTIPAIRTAVLAGGLLAFALSFDEIIVTNFTAGATIQTLPIWIFTNYQRPNNLPLVNVAAVVVLVLSILPVYVASRLSADPSTVAGVRT